MFLNHQYSTGICFLLLLLLPNMLSNDRPDSVVLVEIEDSPG